MGRAAQVERDELSTMTNRSKRTLLRWRRRSPATRRSLPQRASPTMKITYQTPPTPAFRRMVEATPSGMPHWSGTGPPGTVCGQCSFYGYGTQYPNSCYRYYEMRVEHGAAFSAETPSCQYFTPRNEGL